MSKKKKELVSSLWKVYRPNAKYIYIFMKNNKNKISMIKSGRIYMFKILTRDPKVVHDANNRILEEQNIRD